MRQWKIEMDNKNKNTQSYTKCCRWKNWLVFLQFLKVSCVPLRALKSDKDRRVELSENKWAHRVVSLSRSTQSSQKGEVTVTCQHHGESTLPSVYRLKHKKGFSSLWLNEAHYCLWSQPIPHQVKVVKYFGGFVHLSHGDQDLIVNVLLKGSHVKAYSGLQGRVHLQKQREDQIIQAYIHSLYIFF